MLRRPLEERHAEAFYASAEPSRSAIAAESRVPEPREAGEYHRPGRGLGDGGLVVGGEDAGPRMVRTRAEFEDNALNNEVRRDLPVENKVERCRPDHARLVILL